MSLFPEEHAKFLHKQESLYTQCMTHFDDYYFTLLDLQPPPSHYFPMLNTVIKHLLYDYNAPSQGQEEACARDTIREAFGESQ
jgi:hypothetical protein